MYGWIHQSIRHFMIRGQGEEFWEKVIARAGFESGKEAIQNHNYPDAETLKLAEAVYFYSGLTYDQIWECYGRYLVEYLILIGWDKLLWAMSPDLKGFLESLDALHYFGDHVVFKTKLRGPLFRCEDNGNGTLTLHYISDRVGLWKIVYGCVCEASKILFDLDIEMTVIGRNQRIMHTEHGERKKDHVVFLIAPKAGTTLKLVEREQAKQLDGQLRISSMEFMKLFPYHFIIDEECRVVHYGLALGHIISPAILETKPVVTKVFRFYRPQIPIDFDTLVKFTDAVFVLEVRPVPMMTNLYGDLENADTKSIGSLGSLSNMSTLTMSSTLKLKGQMVVLKDNKHIVYLCSPHVHTVKELLHNHLRINTIPLHDQTRDIILLNQHRHREVEMARQLKETEDGLEKMAVDIEEAKQKADRLLKEVLPASIADQLKHGKTVEASEHTEVTLMFSDVPNFGNIVPHTHPKDIVKLLNELFTCFDDLISQHEVYKVETVGDCYVTMAGAPERTENHCESVCNVALGMLWQGTSVLDPCTHKPLIVRLGIHTGPIVTGVVGTKMPRYCLFGDTVNTASRMESHGAPGKIHCSEAAYEAANKTGRFVFEDRGCIQVKGKGEMHTYFLKGSDKYSLWEITAQERDENLHSLEGYDELNRIAPETDPKILTILPSFNPKLSRIQDFDEPINLKLNSKSKICSIL